MPTMSQRPKPLHPFIKYLRKFVQSLPRSNTNGQLALKKSTVHGPGGVQELLRPENILGEENAAAIIRAKFPNQPLFTIPEPAVLADQVIRDNNNIIDQATVDEIARCFRIPNGTRCLFLTPELFYRDLLMDDVRFHIYDRKGVRTGVMLCCPYCKTNKDVKFEKWEILNQSSFPRSVVHVDATRMSLIGVRYRCENRECCGRVPPGEKGNNGDVYVTHPDGSLKTTRDGENIIWNRHAEKEKNHSFLPWTKGCYELLPTTVRSKYYWYVWGLKGEDSPQNLPSPQFAMDVIDTRKNFSMIERSLDTAFEVTTQRARSEYQRYIDIQNRKKPVQQTLDSFLTGQVPQPPAVKWPKFDEVKFRQEFGPPKVDAIETIFWNVFLSIVHLLDADLLRRLPGRIIRWDGTHKAAKKMMAELDLDRNEVLLLVFGEYGDVLAFAFTKAEGATHWMKLHWLIRQRCHKRGHKHLYALIAGYDDLGSGTLNDPTQHWFAKIWPNVKRAPYKDPWHGMDLVTRSTHGHPHPLALTFSADLARCFMLFVGDSVDQAVKELRRKQPSIKDDFVARHQVMNDDNWKKKMYNAMRSPQDQVRALVELRDKTIKEDQEYQKDNQYPPFFRRGTVKVRGTW